MSVTFQAVVQAALRWHLIEVPVHAVPFKLSTVRGRLVDETIDLDKTSALLPADDEEQYGRI